MFILEALGVGEVISAAHSAGTARGLVCLKLGAPLRSCDLEPYAERPSISSGDSRHSGMRRSHRDRVLAYGIVAMGHIMGLPLAAVSGSSQHPAVRGSLHQGLNFASWCRSLTSSLLTRSLIRDNSVSTCQEQSSNASITDGLRCALSVVATSTAHSYSYWTA